MLGRGLCLRPQKANNPPSAATNKGGSMQVVSLAHVGEIWWIVTLEESEHGWDVKEFKPAKGNKSKSVERAKQSAHSRGLSFAEIDFSQQQMEAIASLVQGAIDRKEQRQLEKERRKNELRQRQEMQDANNTSTGLESAAFIQPNTLLISTDGGLRAPVQPRQPAVPPTAEQALLEEIQYLKQQLAQTQRQRDELDKQVSYLQEEVKNLRAQLKKKK